jgi:hypothetical protein
MRRILAGLLTSCLLPLSAAATSITPSAFGSGAILESFEGVVVGPNVRQSPYANIVEPGLLGSYAFGSGVTLTSPVPNPGTLSNGAFVHDFSLPPGASNGWGANGSVSSALDVPFGTAYLGLFDNIHGATVPVSFTLDFSSDVLRAGAYVTGAAGSTVRIDVYGALGNLLESAQVATVPVAAWKTNFLGIESASGIRRLVFTGVDFGIDGLTFEAAPVAVPEPSPLVFLFAGLIGLSAAGRRTRPLQSVVLRRS